MMSLNSSAEEGERPTRTSNASKVGVIGSGLAGLAAAYTLAARGHRVEVFEKNAWLGGKAAQLRASGFRFDMGPTILIQPSMLRRIFKLMRTAGLTDIEDRIVFESALTPQDIHDRYRVLNGAIYGISSRGKWNGAFKPPNRSREAPGLYLAGGAAHPGPGMPMVLMSGWIAADSLDRDVCC